MYRTRDEISFGIYQMNARARMYNVVTKMSDLYRWYLETSPHDRRSRTASDMLTDIRDYTATVRDTFTYDRERLFK